MKKLIITFLAAISIYTELSAGQTSFIVPVNEKLNMAEKLVLDHHNDEALNLLNTVLEENPNHIKALRLRGNLLFLNEEYEASLQDFDQIVLLRPREARSYFNRGIVNFAIGSDEKAMDDIEKAFALNPKMIESLGSQEDVAEKIHEMREKAHTAKFQLRHKGGVIGTKKGGGVVVKAK